MITNERYVLYLQTTNNPKNWEYLHFISNMKELYRKYKGHTGDWLSFSIIDQEEFTEFIKNNIGGNKE